METLSKEDSKKLLKDNNIDEITDAEQLINWANFSLNCDIEDEFNIWNELEDVFKSVNPSLIDKLIMEINSEPLLNDKLGIIFSAINLICDTKVFMGVIYRYHQSLNQVNDHQQFSSLLEENKKLKDQLMNANADVYRWNTLGELLRELLNGEGYNG